MNLVGRIWARRAGRAALPVAALLLAGCGSYPQSIYDVAGPVAKRQLDLLNFTTGVALVIGALVAALAIYAMVRFRDRGHGGRPPQVRGNRRLQILWTVLPLLLVAYKTVPTVSDAFYLARIPEGAMQVRVVGHQWWWEFQYPELGITTANELFIPTGRPIELTITASDVIHSFWVPRLAGKVDAIPGRENKMWLSADKADVYWGQCAELCGTSHSHMSLRVIARSEGEFDAWVRQMKALAENPVQPADAVAARGQELFMGDGICYQCHSIAGTKAQGTFGPNLTGLAIRSTIAAATLENTPEHLAQWIRDPQSIKPRTTMPAVKLTDEEIQAIVAYLGAQK